jgi:hypothetical protein
MRIWFFVCERITWVEASSQPYPSFQQPAPMNNYIHRRQCTWSVFLKNWPAGKFSRINLPSCRQILSAQTQLFSWDGNFNVDSGRQVTCTNCIENSKCSFISPYWENKNTHFLNLQDSTPLSPPCIYHIYQTEMKRKPVKLQQKVSAGKRSLSIIYVHCRLCI